MPAYEYQAVDPAGKARSGMHHGDSARQIRQWLRDQGMTPLQVDELRSTAESHRNGLIGNGGRLSTDERAQVLRQLATLIRAGLPVERVLSTSARQTHSKRSKKVLLAMRAMIAEGQSLANAFEAQPQAFPGMFVASIRAGEESGRLDQVLERLADYAEGQRELKQKAVMALVYPILLSVLALLIVSGIMTFIVPMMVSVFTTMGGELPALTRALIAVSAFLEQWGGYSLIALLVLFVSARWLIDRLPGLSESWHQLVLGLPLIGPMKKQLAAARLIRSLATLIASGVTVLRALQISLRVIDNQRLQQGLKQSARKVSEGSSLSIALKDQTFIAPLTIDLIAAGEASGELAQMLERAAHQMETEIANRIQTFVKLFEPILVVVMGAVVLVIVLGILQPILQMNQLIR